MLLLVILVAAANAFCIAHGPYYVASKALEAGLGDITSMAACKYTNSNVNLTPLCPDQCSALIRVTWGSCYCSQPNYVPNVSPFFNYTVQQIFSFIAIASPNATSAHCRDWINQPEQQAMWKCTGSLKKKMLVN